MVAGTAEMTEPGDARSSTPHDGEQPAAAPLPQRARMGLNRRLAALLMGAALLSKMLGFLREILMAHLLGASLVADSFRGATTAILLPLALLQNDSVTTILIPMFRDWQDAGVAPRQRAALTADLTLAAFALMLGVEMLGGHWVDAMVSGFDATGQALTLDFVRIMALGMPGAVMLNCLAAGEIALGRSRLTSLRAALLNVSILVGIGLLATTGRFSMLAWSFTIAFDGLAIWGLATLWREGVLDASGLKPGLMIATLRELYRRLRPLLVVPIAEQGNIWLERTLASRFITGTVASLDYARTLTESAVLLVSQPLGLVVMSHAPASDVGARVEAIARPILCLVLPGSVFLAIFATDVTRFVFQRGAFDETAVMLTSEALRGIALGLWASTLGWIFLRMLNSAGRNGRVAVILACAFGGNALVNLLTSRLGGSVGGEPLMLGLGETVRWYVLLFGTVFALGCWGRLLKLLGIAAAPTALMAVMGLFVAASVSGTHARLLAGGGVCVACVLLSVGLLMPLAYGAGLRAIRTRLGRAPC